MKRRWKKFEAEVKREAIGVTVGIEVEWPNGSKCRVMARKTPQGIKLKGDCDPEKIKDIFDFLRGINEFKTLFGEVIDFVKEAPK